jgi:hypothetical protein
MLHIVLYGIPDIQTMVVLTFLIVRVCTRYFNAPFYLWSISVTLTTYGISATNHTIDLKLSLKVLQIVLYCSF